MQSHGRCLPHARLGSQETAGGSSWGLQHLLCCASLLAPTMNSPGSGPPTEAAHEERPPRQAGEEVAVASPGPRDTSPGAWRCGPCPRPKPCASLLSSFGQGPRGQWEGRSPKWDLSEDNFKKENAACSLDGSSRRLGTGLSPQSAAHLCSRVGGL